MELQNGIIDFNNLDTAFQLINKLQSGSEDYKYFLYSLSTKKILLPYGGKGSIILLAIQMHKFIAAEYLLNTMSVYDEDQVIAEQLRIAEEIYKGEEHAISLAEEAETNSVKASIYQAIINNNEALSRLKERYLGVKRVRE